MKPKYWHQRKYTLWYDPAFDIQSAKYQHASPTDKRLRAYIDEIKQDIQENGLINPVVVTVRDGIAALHPGKCRANALLELGETTIPAVVASYSRVVDADAIPDGCKFLDDIDEVQQLFSRDNVVYMDHRFFNVTKLAR